MKQPLTSFPLQLLAFLVLPLLVLLVIVAFGGVALHESAMHDLLLTHNKPIVSGVASSLSEQLEKRREILLVLAQTVESEEQAASSLESSRVWSQTFFDGGIALYSDDGRLLAAMPSTTDWRALRNRITFGEAPSTTFSLLVEPGQNITQVILSVSAPSEADVRAVGIVTLDELGLSDTLKSLDTSDNTTVYVAASNGQIIYHSDPAQVGRFLADTPHNEKDVVATSAPVSLPGWTLVHEEGWKEALSPLLRYSQAAPLVLVPGLLITLGAVWFGIQRIVRPLQRLETRATALAWGNFAAIEAPVGGVEEVRRLQATLRQMADRIQSVQNGMHHYIAAITQAQEEERARLARELHDQTVQSLVVLDHRQQMLKPYLSDDTAGAELLSEIRTMISQTIEDLRRIVRAMRPIYLEELGLVPALKMLADELNLNARLMISFEKRGSPRRIPAGHEIALYRIAQEALNNVWKHSEASHVWLSIGFEEDGIILSVRDDGKGFVAPHHAADLSENGHFGIMGMHERASLIGAHLQIQSEPGKGTTVIIRAPLPPDDHRGG